MSILAPRENPHLFMHQPVLERLKAQRAAGRMHHAYMITGLRGIGKATFAYHMARELLAEGQVEAAAEEAGASLFGDALEPPAPAASDNTVHDPDSPLFRRVAVGSHTDLMVVSPAIDARKGEEKAEIGVDVSRKLTEFFSLTPAESEWRVAIIDAVDQLNTNAANAILKILEEPPANCILLLVCHNPSAILPTIRSRCQVVHLATPDTAAFSEIMRHNGCVAPDVMNSFYALSAGSPGRALALQAHDASAVYRDFVLLLASESEQPLPPSLEQLASAKQKAVWDNFRYMLSALTHRITVPSAMMEEVFEGERKALEALREHHDVALWFSWSEAVRHLLVETETFHLDKRATLRMMLNPQRLITQRTQAA